MIRFLTIAGLALRELWISYRLLAAITALILAALPVAFIPHPASQSAGAWTPLGWFAVGVAAALTLVAALAAGALSTERRRGTIGWLASRAVPRQVVVLGWFASFAAVLALGLAPSALVAWITLGDAGLAAGGPAPFVASVVAAWAAGVAGVALGLLLGVLLAPVPAGLLTLLATGVVLLPAALGLLPELAAPPAPGGGLAILAGLPDAARPIADSLRSGGASLVAAAVALVLGAAALGRADL